MTAFRGHASYSLPTLFVSTSYSPKPALCFTILFRGIPCSAVAKVRVGGRDHAGVLILDSDPNMVDSAIRGLDHPTSTLDRSRSSRPRQTPSRQSTAVSSTTTMSACSPLFFPSSSPPADTVPYRTRTQRFFAVVSPCLLETQIRDPPQVVRCQTRWWSYCTEVT